MKTWGLPVPPPTSRTLFWLLVLSVYFGFVASSIVSSVLGAPPKLAISSQQLWTLVAMEMALGAIWIPVLRARGWSLKSISFPLELGDLPHALVLTVACFGANWITVLVAEAFGHHPTKISASMSWQAATALVLVNPLAEESFYLGFVANLTARRGTAFAVAAAVFPRLVLHLAQDPTRLTGILAIGLILGIYYCRSGRLWPIVIAHGVMDAVALAMIRL